jgi:hypothetical protein
VPGQLSPPIDPPLLRRHVRSVSDGSSSPVIWTFTPVALPLLDLDFLGACTCDVSNARRARNRPRFTWSVPD